MTSLAHVALRISTSSICAALRVARALHDAAMRLREVWIWRHGRERAAICGVIEC